VIVNIERYFANRQLGASLRAKVLGIMSCTETLPAPSGVALLAVVLGGLWLLGPPIPHAQAQVETGPTTRFEFKEVFSIGGDEEAPVEYLFSNPKHIRTDA